MSKEYDHIDFQFAPNTTDAQRHQISSELMERYGGFIGAAGVENPFFRVQPGGHYAVALTQGEDADQVAGEIRLISGIDPASVRVSRAVK